MLEFILFCIGLFVVIKGADYLVDGASSLAGRFRISPIVIGLTVVAFGTSAPELVVSVTSALKGSTDIALGNVIGSNVFNILLILGLSAVIYPLKVMKNTSWKEIPFSFLGVILIVILGLQVPIDTGFFSLSMFQSSEVIGTISRSNGLVLLSFFIIFLYYTFGISKTTGEEGLQIKKMSIFKMTVFIVGGLLALAFGSQIAVDNAISLARLFQISDTVIGLTLVAAGTSAPELFTSITAVRKKNSDIAVGNVVGSNIFNIFLILGVTSTVKEIPIKGIQLIDLVMLFGTTLILFASVFVWKRHSIGRKEGMIMVCCFVLYMVYLLVRG